MKSSLSQFPNLRLRRLRSTPSIRQLFNETKPHPSNLVAPFFVREDSKTRTFSALPDHPQYNVSDLLKHLEGFVKKGGQAIILFGIPNKKDPMASEAYNTRGVIQKAVRQIKEAFDEKLVVMTDLCFCEYTDHGHCGILQGDELDNDATLQVIAKTAVSQAQAGSDIIAPSGMTDGQVKTIRAALDKEGFKNTLILSYAAKFASTLYGPFREMAESTPSFGNRKTYQMNPSNTREALREIALDVEEGADCVMVKPAMFYLDVLTRAKEKFDLPLAAFQVSGEAWMIEEYAKRGFAKREDLILESLTAIKRAGADLIITYFTEELLLKK